MWRQVTEQTAMWQQKTNSQRSEGKRWRGRLLVALASGGFLLGCMEESPDLMMGGAPGAPAPGDPQAVPPPPVEGAVAGSPLPEGASPGAAVALEGAGTGSGDPATGALPGTPAAEPGQGSGLPALAGTGTPPEGAAPAVAGSGTLAAPSGTGTPGSGAPPVAGAGTGSGSAAPASDPSLLSRLFSSQTTTAPAQTTSSGQGMPRVQQSVQDKPLYAAEDLAAPGKGVTVSGTVTCAVCKGTILINVVSAKGLIATSAKQPIGAYTVRVPASVGEVTLTAIGDDNSDGAPTTGEPLGGYMKNPVSVGASDISGIDIEIGRALPPPIKR